MCDLGQLLSENRFSFRWIQTLNGNSAKINVQLSTNFRHEYITTHSTDDLIQNPRRDEASLDNDRLPRVQLVMP